MSEIKEDVKPVESSTTPSAPSTEEKMYTKVEVSQMIVDRLDNLQKQLLAKDEEIAKLKSDKPATIQPVPTNNTPNVTQTVSQQEIKKSPMDIAKANLKAQLTKK